MPDPGCAVVPEGDEQVAHGARVGAEGVVALGLVRAAVTDQVGSDDGESASERGQYASPRGGVGGDSVDQKDHGAAAAHPVGDLLTVQGQFAEFEFVYRVQESLAVFPRRETLPPSRRVRPASRRILAKGG